MKFDPINFLVGSEMAKRELGSGRQDRANQLGLVAAMMPFPMGAFMASVMAKNEGPSPSSATPTMPFTSGSPPATRGPIEIHLGDQIIRGDQPIPFGKRFKGEGDGKVVLTVTIKNPNGPTVKLQTDGSSGQQFRIAVNRDDTFRQGDVLEQIIEFDTSIVGTHKGWLFLEVNGVERKVPITGEVVEQPVAAIRLAGQRWSSETPQLVRFAATGENSKKELVIDNTGLIDFKLSLLQGCEPPGYRFVDNANVDVKEKLKNGLTVPSKTSMTVVLEATDAAAGLNAFVLTRDNSCDSFQDLLIALFEKRT
jgi:hypothetical protein